MNNVQEAVQPEDGKQEPEQVACGDCGNSQALPPSEAFARACVSTYSRNFVNLPFRTAMSKTQLSSNVLLVALIFPVAKPTTRTRSPCAMNSGGFGNEVCTASLAFGADSLTPHARGTCRPVASPRPERSTRYLRQP